MKTRVEQNQRTQPKALEQTATSTAAQLAVRCQMISGVIWKLIAKGMRSKCECLR